MNKNEFLKQLEMCLAQLPQAERNEIMQDFEEHFAVGLESGKTEQQICEDLGSPQSCAEQYISEKKEAFQKPDGRPAYQGERQYYGINGNTAPPKDVDYAANAAAINEKRNRTVWRVVFFVFVFCAFFVYPVACGLLLAPVIVLIVASAFLEVLPGALAIVFLGSLCLMLFTAGLFAFLLMTWLLKLSFKKSEF